MIVLLELLSILFVGSFVIALMYNIMKVFLSNVLIDVPHDMWCVCNNTLYTQGSFVNSKKAPVLYFSRTANQVILCNDLETGVGMIRFKISLETAIIDPLKTSDCIKQTNGISQFQAADVMDMMKNDLFDNVASYISVQKNETYTTDFHRFLKEELKELCTEYGLKLLAFNVIELSNLTTALSALPKDTNSENRGVLDSLFVEVDTEKQDTPSNKTELYNHKNF